MSRYIDGTWLLNFFVDLPDDYTLTIGNLRAIVNDAPTAECFTCGMERVKDEKYGSLPTLVYNPENVPDEVLEANDRLVSLADVCKLIKREWQINPHQWGELARLPSINLVRCKECKYEQHCRKAVEHITHEPTSVTIGYKTVKWCSYGEREGE